MSKSNTTEPHDDVVPDVSEPANRDGSGRDSKTGRFTPGNAANKSGRPRDVHGIGELARSYAPAVIRHLAVLALGRGPAAVAACKELLDRGLGKPTQAIDATIRRGSDDAIAGNPDAARAKLEALIVEAERQSLPAVTTAEATAADAESGSTEVASPTENGASETRGSALPVRSSGEGTP